MRKILLCWLLVGWSAGALGQNVLLNSTFDQGPQLTSWSTFTGDISPAGTGTVAWSGSQDVATHTGVRLGPGGRGHQHEHFGFHARHQPVRQPRQQPHDGPRRGPLQGPLTGQSDPASGLAAAAEVFFYTGAGCVPANFVTGGSAGKVLTALDRDDGTWYAGDIGSPDCRSEGPRASGAPWFGPSSKGSGRTPRPSRSTSTASR